MASEDYPGSRPRPAHTDHGDARRRRSCPDDYRRILASTLEEIDRLTLIGDALVLLGRFQAGEVTLDLAEIDARVLAREAVAEAQEGVGSHPVNLVQPAEPVLIRADVRLMRMVLDQLLDNARRYTPPGSRIEIAVQADEGEAVITVEDDGPGVADDVLPHLFEPFYRSDTARAREGGPGLGLTVTVSIVTLHGGTVVANRGSGGGLRVTVTLLAAERPSATGAPRDTWASLGHGRHGEGADAGWVGKSSDQGER
jgi:two-component system OmpR family sensor kinase